MTSNPTALHRIGEAVRASSPLVEVPTLPVTSAVAEYRVTNLIDEMSAVSGHVRSPGGIRVKGRVHGVIEVPTNDEGPAGDVMISEGAELEGVIVGWRVFVFGKVTGTVIAKESLVVGPTGVITDGIAYARMKCDEGSEIGGTANRITSATNTDDLLNLALERAGLTGTATPTRA